MIRKIVLIVLFCNLQNTFGQIVLPSMRGVFNSKVPTTMYSGGKGLGTSQQSTIQNACPPELMQTIYYGGKGLGDQQEVIVQNTCVAPPIETIFYGGLGYGTQQEVIVQNTCTTPPIQTIFYGGDGFGDQQKSVIQNICLSPPIEEIFYGGNGFGDRQQKLIQTNCSADGRLNYTIFTTASLGLPNYPRSENDFLNYTNLSNQTSSGTYSSTVLLDWTSWTTLSNVGISIPNGGNNFAVQVSGFFIPEESGVYFFTCVGDDAVDLFVNNVNVVRYYGGQSIKPLGTLSGRITLVAGTKYTFRARMQDNDLQEGLRVFWRKPSQTGWQINVSEISAY